MHGSSRSLILTSVHAAESALLAVANIVCESPLCSACFPQTGLKMEPRRYCSDECRNRASIIRRAAALLIPIGKDKTWQALLESVERQKLKGERTIGTPQSVRQ